MKLKFKNFLEWFEIQTENIETMLWVLRALFLSSIVALCFMVYVLFLKDEYNEIYVYEVKKQVNEIKKQDSLKNEIILRLIDKMPSDRDTITGIHNLLFVPDKVTITNPDQQ